MIEWFEWFIGACNWLVQVIVRYTISISSLPVGHGDDEPTILDVRFTGGGPNVGYGGAALKTNISCGTPPLMWPFEHYKMCGARVMIGILHLSRLLYR
jgi:hypothetical protein